MNWTKEQQRAIELKNKNILVAAAAGSGKTAVLVERIKRLILEDRCPIDNAYRHLHQRGSRRNEGKDREGDFKVHRRNIGKNRSRRRQNELKG